MSDDDFTTTDAPEPDEGEPIGDEDDEDVPFAPTDVPDPGPVEDDEGAP